ncbi:SpoU rRNA methylase family enzyme [Microbacterium sp. SORGH_AS428]|uniref:SCO7613 C-terminal domain-containing membrane protein n=1 Tax=Microbacterium sp. SORGH_AS_0428 TaxID=3041788 RepID=UPI00286794DC|nr:hypothetical protein [Microbacterium sp. SORGH_AS_0428]MDR6199805.1 SpoU rRNA methylase family enzyme [Microbacterium sp. SORGH_AS_0428]
MTDTPQGGRWPASARELGDPHKCPSCFTVISGSPCPACGQPLDDPRMGQVLAIGQTMADAEATRQSIMTAVRESAVAARQAALAERAVLAEQAAVAARQQAVPPAVVTPAPAAPEPAASGAARVGPALSAPVVAAPASPPPGPQSPTPAPAPRRRRLTVPVLLLIVGVSLVGVAAVFFLLLAWFVAGIALRAVIVAAITLLTIGGASLLRRQGLTATAEGVAALGVVLLGLDAWAVYANDLFGAASFRPAVWTGIGAFAVAVIGRAWARISRLRTPDLAASLALPAGIGFLVGGAVAVPPPEALIAGLLGAAVGGLAHALPAPASSARSGETGAVERFVLAIVGLFALAVGALLTPLFAEGIGAAVWANAGVVVIGSAYAFVLRPAASERVAGAWLGAAASVLAALSLATAGWQLAARSDLPVFGVLVAPVLAVATAVALDRLRVRLPWLVPAAIAAGVVAVCSLAVHILMWSTRAALAISGNWSLWRTPAFESAGGSLEIPLLALVAAAVLSVLLFVAPAARRDAVRHLRPIVGTLLLTSAAGLTLIPAAAVAGGVVVAAASVVAMRRRADTTGWVVAGFIGAGTAYLTGLSAIWLWVAAVAVASLLPVAHRLAARAAGGLAVAFAVLPIGVLAVSATIAPNALSVQLGGASDAAAAGCAFVLLQWVALVAALASLLGWRDAASRRALALATTVLLAVSLPAAAALGTSPLAERALLEPGLGIARAALLVVALIALTARHRESPVAWASAAFVALAAASGAVALLALIVAPRFAAALVTAAVAAVVIAGGAALALRVRVPRVRLAADLGAAVVILLAAWPTPLPGGRVLFPIPAEWRGTFVAIIAIAIGAASVTRGWRAQRAGGVPVTAAPRRLLAWPAFAGATAALWLWLGSAWPDAALEAYVVPPAVGLVAFAVLLSRLGRIPEATVAAAVGVGVGLLPLAATALSADATRGIVAAAIAAAVAGASAFLARLRSSAPGLAMAATALGALLLATSGLVVTGPEVAGLWAAAAVAVTLIVSAGLAREASAAAVSVATVAGPVATFVAAAAVVIAVATHGSFAVGLTLVLVLLALHLVSAGAHRVPLTPALRWTTWAVALVAGALMLAGGVFTEVEPAFAPAGVALAAGAVVAALRADRTSPLERTAWLAGLAITALPSVLAPVEPLRTWLVISLALAAALILVLAPLPDIGRLKTPSALVLLVAVWAMAVRSAGTDATAPTIASLVAGIGTVAVAVGMVRIGARAGVPSSVAAVGSTFVVASVALRLDGAPATTAVTMISAALVGVASALVLGRERWRGVAAVAAVASAATLATAAGTRILLLTDLPGALFTIEPEIWTLAALGLVTAIAVAALRTRSGSHVDIAAMIVLSAGVGAFTIAELAAFEGAQFTLRVLLIMVTLSAAGTAGWALRRRNGLVLLGAAGAFALVTAASTAPAVITMIEVITAPPAVAGLAVGIARMRAEPARRSWPALGGWLALLTLPSLAYDIDPDAALWRVVALGAVAIALVVIGAVRALQAPLVVGSAVLLVHAIAQLWPWIAAAYVAFWWLWLGLGGVALIFLAARYEKRMRALKAAFAAVTALR